MITPSPTLRLALRELKAQWRRFTLFTAAISLGVLVLVGVAETVHTLRAMVGADTRALLGADLRLEAAKPLEPFLESCCREPGITLSHTKEFSTMANTPGGNSLLVGVKAVDGAYPLRGRFQLVEGGSLAHALADGGAVAESALLQRLGLQVGKSLQLGEATFTITGIIAAEPDRVTSLFNLGPQLLIPLERVEETGLARFGSRIRHVASLKLPPDRDPEALARELERRALGQGVRVVTPAESQPIVRRFVKRFTLFLTLASLFTLVLGGVAMAGSVATFVGERRKTVAILKCLGADNRQVLAIHAWQVGIMALGGSLLGAAGGVAVPWLLLHLLGDLFPALPPYAPHWGVALLGVGMGVGCSALFAAGPLWGVRGVSPQLLFRAVGWGEAVAVWQRGLGWVGGGLLLLGGVAAGMAGEGRMGAAFALGGGGAALLLLLLARGALGLLGRWHPRPLPVRLAVGGVVRPGSGAAVVILALGLGLTAVFTVVLLERNLVHQIHSRLPAKAPSFFFIDLQPDQVEPFRHIAAGYATSPDDLRVTPVIRGMLTAYGSTTVTPEMLVDHPQAWRFNREYVLTTDADLPANNILEAGRWWAHPEEVGASLEQGMARGLGVEVGDTIAFEIQGVTVEAPVLSIRSLHWADMGLNFFVIFSPAALAGAPLTAIATVAAPPAREEALHREVTQRFANVVAIPTRAVLETVRQLLERLAAVVRLVGGMAVAAGLLVLGVSVTASRGRRAREAAVYRLLGAERRTLLAAAWAEFGMLGLVAAGGALLVAQGVAAGVVRVMMEESWLIYPEWSVGALLVGVGVVAAVGVLATRPELERPVLGVLRG